MSPLPKREPVFSFEQLTFACLLVVGLFFPSSINGEHSTPAILVAYAILIGLLTYVVWKQGIDRKALAFVSLPILLVLVGTSLYGFIRGPFDLDGGLFVKFSVLALVLALDLRRSRSGAFVDFTFALANCVNIACGIAILVGSEWVTDLLPTYYWTSDPKLVPLMMSLHKPVLTFGSHSLAGLFIYLFFWINWQEFSLRGKRFSLLFALGYFVLLLGLASFTAFGFAALAAAQMAISSWKSNPRLTVAVALCVIATVSILTHALVEEIDDLGELPQIADTAFLNGDFSGPVSRYGINGSLRPAIMYLFDHPFSPIGLSRSASGLDVSSPTHFFVGDSGPVEYLLRGSVPLLVLIYFGLYRFLRRNLVSRAHSTTLFLVILAFEAGFSALDSSRTFFLLPFFVVYLNQTVTQRMSCSPHGVAFPERQAVSV